MADPSNDSTDRDRLAAQLHEATQLLITARHFDNQTVQDNEAVAAWRRRLDDWLRGKPGDSPLDRFDTPRRIAARRFVANLFRPRHGG